MIDEALFKKFFLKFEHSVDKIIEFSKFTYELASFRKGHLLSTEYFIRIVKTVSQKLNLAPQRIQAIQYKLYDTIKSYRTRDGQKVRVAELKTPIMIRTIIRQLWYSIRKTDTASGRLFSHAKMVLRRYTAVQTLLVAVTGRRWIDITRLRWEFAKIHHLPHATLIKIGIFISKPNKKGRRNESITLIKDDTDLCPVRLLIGLWILNGKPKTGWIFPCIRKSRIFKRNRLFDEWSAFCCTLGHRRGEKRIECLGEIDGDTTEGMMKRTAEKVGFTSPPTKHTFRRTLVIMALKLGVERDRINEHFGWNFDSKMIAHYAQDHLGTEKNGLPCLIAKNMTKKDFLDDIVIKN